MDHPQTTTYSAMSDKNDKIGATESPLIASQMPTGRDARHAVNTAEDYPKEPSMLQSE